MPSSSGMAPTRSRHGKRFYIYLRPAESIPDRVRSPASRLCVRVAASFISGGRTAADARVLLMLLLPHRLLHTRLTRFANIDPNLQTTHSHS